MNVVVGRYFWSAFLWLILICAALTGIVVILPLVGLFDIGIPMSGQPYFHRAVTNRELGTILCIAAFVVLAAFLLLHKIHVNTKG